MTWLAKIIWTIHLLLKNETVKTTFLLGTVVVTDNFVLDIMAIHM